MTAPRKTPQRTCVACRSTTGKRELVRLVRTKDGDVRVDVSGRVAGRGAYVCPAVDCFEEAAAGMLAKALRARLTEEDIERLRREFEAAITADAASVQGR